MRSGTARTPHVIHAGRPVKLVGPGIIIRSMRELSWSAAEKKIARAAFDRAYERECQAIHREVQSMLRNARDCQVIWALEEYLRERRREIDQKYDYRYSVLPLLFGRLYNESWLTEEDLTGLAAEKLQLIKRAPAL